MPGGGFSRATVESRRELRTGSALDGKLPAGNHRQFRCYCPLEPFRKACILSVLTEGQLIRVTVSGNRFLAEFRRATEYRMTSTIRNTPFGPSQLRGVGRWRHALACRSVILGKPVPAEVCPASSLHENNFRHDSTLFITFHHFQHCNDRFRGPPPSRPNRPQRGLGARYSDPQACLLVIEKRVALG